MQYSALLAYQYSAYRFPCRRNIAAILAAKITDFTQISLNICILRWLFQQTTKHGFNLNENSSSKLSRRAIRRHARSSFGTEVILL